MLRTFIRSAVSARVAGRSRGLLAYSSIAVVVVAAVLTVATSLLGVASGAVMAAGPSIAGDRATATRISLQRSDLPDGISWKELPNVPDTAADSAERLRAVACVAYDGGSFPGVSSDPFGLAGAAIGDVTVDVRSATFAVLGPSQPLGVSSDVVMTDLDAQASVDLRALSTAAGIKCISAYARAVISAEHDPRGTKVAVRAIAVPSLAGIGSGIGLRFTISSPLRPTLICEAYLYAVGRAEIQLRFSSARKPFPVKWASEISKRVVSRAEALVNR